MALRILFLLLGFWGLPWQTAWAAGPEQMAALQTDQRCPPPKTSSSTSHGRETIRYDLVKKPTRIGNRTETIWGLYTASSRIGWQAQIQRGCVESIKVVVQVTGSISLCKSLALKANRCKRQITLDHEYGHARIARAHYKGLGRSLEEMVSVMFRRKRVEDFATLGRHFNIGRDILMAGFKKRYKRAQAEFHAKLKRSDIIEKDCHLRRNRPRGR